METMKVSTDSRPPSGDTAARARRLRRHMLLSGALGLVGCALVCALAIWLVSSGRLEPWFPQRWVVWVLVFLLGGFSLAEIPLMVFAMRRLAVERTENQGAVTGLNALYVFFAGVYGAPVFLLTGHIGWGLALSSLSLVRLIASWLFVAPPPGAQMQERDGES